jgi:hypothetical protein
VVLLNNLAGTRRFETDAVLGITRGQMNLKTSPYARVNFHLRINTGVAASSSKVVQCTLGYTHLHDRMIRHALATKLGTSARSNKQMLSTYQVSRET